MNEKQNITWKLITGAGLMSKGILHLSFDCSVLNVSPDRKAYRLEHQEWLVDLLHLPLKEQLCTDCITGLGFVCVYLRRLTDAWLFLQPLKCGPIKLNKGETNWISSVYLRSASKVRQSWSFAHTIGSIAKLANRVMASASLVVFSRVDILQWAQSARKNK